LDDDHTQYYNEDRLEDWFSSKDTDDLTEGDTNLFNKFPDGGTANQFLVKVDATDFNATWQDVDTDDITEGTTNLYNKLPAGGATGEVLEKIDGTDYNVQWSAVSGGGGLNNVVEDLTPELGGDLDTAGNNIFASTNLVLYAGQLIAMALDSGLNDAFVLDVFLNKFRLLLGGTQIVDFGADEATYRSNIKIEDHNIELLYDSGNSVGITVEGEAGENLSADQPVRIDNGLWYSVDSTDDVPCSGLAIEGITSGNTGTILLYGIYNTSGSWTTGEALYVSAGGALTQTKPTSGFIKTVGVADTTTRIYFTPSAPTSAEVGDMLASVYDPTNIQGDAFDRANHTGTQTASTISDFDTEVSNNTDVAANTAARHDAVTVTDSAEIDFTLVGQDITASIVAGSIDEAKLDASTNASLDLADSSVQPGDNISTLTNDSGFITDVVADTTPQLGGTLETAGNEINLDDSNIHLPTPTNGAYNGITIDGTNGNGSNHDLGDLVYLASTGEFFTARADLGGPGTPVMAMAAETIASSGSGKYLLMGTVTSSTLYSGFTAGNELFLSAGVAGAATNTAPTGSSELVQKIGIALGSNTIYFNPSLDEIELA
jgi:hypothetical protein